MTSEELKQHIRQITVWKRGEQRAPHKPLLLLYALGRCLNDGERLLPYGEVDRELRPLLIEYGPERKSCHTEYPFQRLTNDGIRELQNAAKLETRSGHSDVKKSELLKHNVSGGFTPEVFAMLRSHPALISELALEILNQHFPQTFSADLLDAVGLEIQFEQTLRRRRDPAFRDRVLMVYGRMGWDDVAPTLTTGCFNPSKGRFLHPVEDRTITIREAALLQTFPRHYKFPAELGKVTLATQIGNALPPEFIKRQAIVVKKYLEKNSKRF